MPINNSPCTKIYQDHNQETEKDREKKQETCLPEKTLDRRKQPNTHKSN
jgi:hypothetical protein